MLMIWLEVILQDFSDKDEYNCICITIPVSHCLLVTVYTVYVLTEAQCARAWMRVY